MLLCYYAAMLSYYATTINMMLGLLRDVYPRLSTIVHSHRQRIECHDQGPVPEEITEGKYRIW